MTRRSCSGSSSSAPVCLPSGSSQSLNALARALRLDDDGGELAAEDYEQHAGRKQVVARGRSRPLPDERVVEDVQDREPDARPEDGGLAIREVSATQPA
jgi:hypothetical protein